MFLTRSTARDLLYHFGLKVGHSSSYSPGLGCCCSFCCDASTFCTCVASQAGLALWFWVCARPVCSKGGKLTTVTTSYLAGCRGCSRYILCCHNRREALQPQVKHTKPTASVQIIKFHLLLSTAHSPRLTPPPPPPAPASLGCSTQPSWRWR